MPPLHYPLFHALFPRCPGASATLFLPHFNAACLEFDITTGRRLAAFCAQLGHESADLTAWEERASGEDYEGRRDLGNLLPGDGPRYKGRGPIQLTGRANYRAAGEALGLPLEAEPHRAAWRDTGFRVAGWYWTTRGLNELADQGPAKFEAITRRINGGLNGQPDRLRRYARALEALRCN